MKNRKELDDLENRAQEIIDGGENPHFSMTYEDGIVDTIQFLIHGADDPLEE